MSPPGYFMAVGNHIPNSVPAENIEYSFGVFDEMRSRFGLINVPSSSHYTALPPAGRRDQAAPRGHGTR